MISPASAAAVEAAADLAGAYVHIPFCARVCPYCDFTVVAGRDEVIDRYIAALERDIASMPPWRPLDAVFVGGGTPSRVSPALLERVLTALGDRHGVVTGAEVTIEANPEDIDQAAAEALRRAGFTRISLGVQSFDDAVLADLGRLHDAQTATRAVRAAVDSEFDSVSVDLIFGSPVETAASWDHSLAAVIELEPDHVSAYSLTVEPGTLLWKRVRAGAESPDGDGQADRWERAEAALAAAGYERYEVSNHALPGHHCRYNAAVWGQGEYLAFGVGAHGFRDGVRTANVRRLDTYMDRVERGIGPVQTAEVVEGWAREQERLLLGLRRAAGVEPGEAGEALVASPAGARLVEFGVISIDGGRLRVDRPLLTDEVLRVVLSLDPPG
ncbi:MAG TPA: radical SAM family heme chaperone HemW [Acidimicrobiia bacterium]|nr:radical SAM family heme chaperone HemW [Acidimicrobiia bacterium]